VINAFTIDVEEWFHVCGVPAVADPSSWDALESRVADDMLVAPGPPAQWAMPGTMYSRAKPSAPGVAARMARK
jgi:hypothetical protein